MGVKVYVDWDVFKAAGENCHSAVGYASPKPRKDIWSKETHSCYHYVTWGGGHMSRLHCSTESVGSQANWSHSNCSSNIYELFLFPAVSPLLAFTWTPPSILAVTSPTTVSPLGFAFSSWLCPSSQETLSRDSMATWQESGWGSKARNTWLFMGWATDTMGEVAPSVQP